MGLLAGAALTRTIAPPLIPLVLLPLVLLPLVVGRVAHIRAASAADGVEINPGAFVADEPAPLPHLAGLSPVVVPGAERRPCCPRGSGSRR